MQQIIMMKQAGVKGGSNVQQNPIAVTTKPQQIESSGNQQLQVQHHYQQGYQQVYQHIPQQDQHQTRQKRVREDIESVRNIIQEVQEAFSVRVSQNTLLKNEVDARAAKLGDLERLTKSSALELAKCCSTNSIYNSKLRDLEDDCRSLETETIAESEDALKNLKSTASQGISILDEMEGDLELLTKMFSNVMSPTIETLHIKVVEAIDHEREIIDATIAARDRVHRLRLLANLKDEEVASLETRLAEVNINKSEKSSELRELNALHIDCDQKILSAQEQMSSKTQELQSQRLIWNATRSTLGTQVEESDIATAASKAALIQARSKLQEVDRDIEQEATIIKREEERQRIQQENELALTMQLGAANELSTRLNAEHSLVKEQNWELESNIQRVDEKLRALNAATRTFETKNESIFVEIQSKMRAWHELCREEPNLKWELKKANADLEEHRKRREAALAETNQEISVMQGEIDSIRSTISNMHQEEEELKKELEMKADCVAQQESENSSAKVDIEEMRRCIDLNRNIKDAITLLDAITRDCSDLTHKVNESLPRELDKCNESIARVQESMNDITRGDNRLLLPLPEFLQATVDARMMELQRQAEEVIDIERAPIQANIQAIKDRKLEELRKFEENSAKIAEMGSRNIETIKSEIEDQRKLVEELETTRSKMVIANEAEDAAQIQKLQHGETDTNQENNDFDWSHEMDEYDDDQMLFHLDESLTSLTTATSFSDSTIQLPHIQVQKRLMTADNSTALSSKKPPSMMTQTKQTASEANDSLKPSEQSTYTTHSKNKEAVVHIAPSYGKTELSSQHGFTAVNQKRKVLTTETNVTEMQPPTVTKNKQAASSVTSRGENFSNTNISSNHGQTSSNINTPRNIPSKNIPQKAASYSHRTMQDLATETTRAQSNINITSGAKENPSQTQRKQKCENRTIGATGPIVKQLTLGRKSWLHGTGDVTSGGLLPVPVLGAKDGGKVITSKDKDKGKTKPNDWFDNDESFLI